MNIPTIENQLQLVNNQFETLKDNTSIYFTTGSEFDSILKSKSHMILKSEVLKLYKLLDTL